MKWIHLVLLAGGIVLLIIILIATESVVISGFGLRELLMVGGIFGLALLGIFIFVKWPTFFRGGKIIPLDPIQKAKDYFRDNLDIQAIPSGLPQKMRIGKDDYYAVQLISTNKNHDLGVRQGTTLLAVLDSRGAVVGPSPHNQINPSVDFLSDPFQDIKPKVEPITIVERPAVEREITKMPEAEAEEI